MKALLSLSEAASRLVFAVWIRPLEALLLRMVGPARSVLGGTSRAVASWLKDLGWLLFTRFRVNVVQWEGAEWRVTFIHDGTTHSKEELVYLLFPERPVERDLGWVFLWRVPAMVRSAAKDGFLVVCDLNRLLHWGTRQRCSFRVPPWLRANMDLSESREAVLARMSESRRRAVRGLADSGYSCEFTRSPDALDMFYHRMYVPYVKQRHKERAIVEPRETKRAIFEKGGLMLVHYRGQPVAGGLWRFAGDMLIDATYALRPDHVHLRQEDVFVALHWYMVEWALQNHFRSIDLGMTRPRLEDGPFEYKRRWGAVFCRDILTHTVWTFVADEPSEELVEHLNDLTLIGQADGGYGCLLLARNGQVNLSGKEYARRERVALDAGLSGLTVLTLG